MTDLDLKVDPSAVRPALTAARERKLLALTRSSRDARAASAAALELWEHHENFVASIAGRYRRPADAEDAVIAAGHAGLREAIAHFPLDAEGTRLASFAITRIRWHIQHELRGGARPLPVHARAGYRQTIRLGAWMIADARRSCAREGTEATDAALTARLAARTGLPADAVAAALACASHAKQAADAVDEGGVSRLDHVRARRRVIHLAETILGHRERVVFLARCLASGGAAVSVDKLASTLGVPPDRIDGIEASARRKIATAAAVEQLADPLGTERPISDSDRERRAIASAR